MGAVVDNGIRAAYLPGPGYLVLTCEPAAFARLRDLVATEPAVADALRQAGDGRLVQVAVCVRDDRPPSPTRWWDRLFLLGCATVGSAILFVFTTGVMTLVGWAR